MKQCKKCGNTFKNFQIINGRRCNLSKRKFCTICSPYGARNTRDLTKVNINFANREQRLLETSRICKRCRQTLPANKFYSRGGSRAHQLFSYCKACHKINMRERLKRFKQQCVSYKGGQCIKCGYNKSYAALDFHHKDGNKEFGIGEVKNRSFNQKIIKELDKCELICANCHRELHSDVEDKVVESPVFQTGH